MTGGTWRWLRLAVGAGILVTVLVVTGSGPVADGVRALDPVTVLLGAALGALATLSCAWRWRLVAGRFGIGIGLGTAVAACYRAQLLNTTLPGGVVGDVHRGVVHGRAAGGAVPGLRNVAWERLAGQLVLAVSAAVVLVLLPSPARPSPAVALVVVAVGVAGVGLLARGTWPGVWLASVVALACYLATYVVAARAVGVTDPAETLVPLSVLVLAAAGLPTNVAGWGPREGMAAWAFGAAGLGADQGLASAVAYGALVLVANLPGLVVLLVRRHADG